MEQTPMSHTPKHAMTSKREILIGGLALLITMMGFGCDPETEESSSDNQFNVYYVSNQGDDATDGQTMETAFQTIGRTLEIVWPGDTVLILPGIYNEALTLEGVGSSEAPIIIQGEGGAAVLDGQKNMAIGIWCEQGTNIIFEKLEIRDYTDIGIGALSSSNITLRNLTVHQNGMNSQLEDWEN